jgi:hypothetical protein
MFRVGPLPSQVENVEKVDALSPAGQITIKWKAPNDSMEVLAYRVYANAGRNDNLKLVYEGTAQLTQFTFTAAENSGELIDPRLLYRLQVSAVNFNGEGIRSQVVSVKSCTTPKAVPQPRVVVPGVNAEAKVAWEAPGSDGGCPLLSYHLWLKEINQAEWAEVDASQINNNTYVRSHTIDMQSFTFGDFYQVKISVDNAVGSAESDSTVFLLANLPGQPPKAERVSDGRTLQVVMSPPEEDGSSQITGYSLETRALGEEKWIVRTTENNLKLTYLIDKSELKPASFIQVRYRCRNPIGFSEYSDSVYLLMAGKPERPPQPVYLASEATSITVSLGESRDMNGAPITHYTLYRDEGDSSSELEVVVQTFAAFTSQYTITDLTPGVIYRIALTASNSEGESQ